MGQRLRRTTVRFVLDEEGGARLFEPNGNLVGLKPGFSRYVRLEGLEDGSVRASEAVRAESLGQIVQTAEGGTMWGRPIGQVEGLGVIWEAFEVS